MNYFISSSQPSFDIGIIITLPIIHIGKLRLMELNQLLHSHTSMSGSVIGIQVCLALSFLPFHHTTLPLCGYLYTLDGSENARLGYLSRVTQVVEIVSRQESKFPQSLALFLYNLASKAYKGISTSLIWFYHCTPLWNRTSFLPYN